MRALPDLKLSIFNLVSILRCQIALVDPGSELRTPNNRLGYVQARQGINVNRLRVDRVLGITEFLLLQVMPDLWRWNVGFNVDGVSSISIDGRPNHEAGRVTSLVEDRQVY